MGTSALSFFRYVTSVWMFEHIRGLRLSSQVIQCLDVAVVELQSDGLFGIQISNNLRSRSCDTSRPVHSSDGGDVYSTPIIFTAHRIEQCPCPGQPTNEQSRLFGCCYDNSHSPSGSQSSCHFGSRHPRASGPTNDLQNIHYQWTNI